MNKPYLAISLSFLIAVNSVTAADNADLVVRDEAIGFGTGALIGGLIGGPIGAVVGAAGGALFGTENGQHRQQVADLEKQLQQREIELADIQTEFTRLQDQHQQSLQKVALDQYQGSLQELADGVRLSVFFKTNQSELEPRFKPGLQRLASYLNQFPEIRIQLSAHADQRGNRTHNQVLSEQRAYAVLSELVNAGLSNKRIYIDALGESGATVPVNDIDGLAHERRVDLELTLDTQI